ncbi:hypothetical protein [Lysobacter sp. A289]
MSPLDSFIAWYDSLPLSHRQDIAGFSFGVLPGYERDSMLQTEGIETRFKDQLSASSEDKLHALGHLLSLRALIEFFFIRTRGTKAAWDETHGFLSSAKSFFEQQGHAEASQRAETGLNELEFRSEQWLRTTEKWKVLRQAELSDEALDSWWQRGER